MKAPEVPKISERQLQSGVIELAQRLGWRVAHFRTVKIQRADGSTHYATPVQADGAGFLDLCMVRWKDGRLIFAELKSQRGVVGSAQEDWIIDLGHTKAEVYVWKPSDYLDGTIERCLN